MKNRFLKGLLVASLLAFQGAGNAEDIDLFVGVEPTEADAPNVLIVLDNTANWNQPFTNEIAALVSTVSNLPVNADGSAKFRVGLMMFSEAGGANATPDGGYVRAAVRSMTAANKAKYLALLNSLTKSSGTGDGSTGGHANLAMAEAYRYFSGGAPYSGNNKVKTDYAGNTSGTAASNAIYAMPGNALASKAGSPYVSPLTSGSCAKNFIIYISNGAPQDNSTEITTASGLLDAAAAALNPAPPGASPAIPISPADSKNNVVDEWARFMKQSPQKVTTYTVDVDKVTTGQGPGWTALLKSMASASSGKYFDVNSSTGGGSQIAVALNTIFSEIQSVNSVFAAVSLPVSVNTQGTYLNQVFVGMFRPDQNGFPRWAGNLKQFKLGYLNGTLQLLDADGASAISSGGTGFIAECSRSFWTPSAVDTYWAFKPQGNCLSVANSNASNYPDGNIVEKGAQAYQLRSTTTRTVKTCSSVFASCTAMTDFNNTNVTQTLLGAASTTERDALISWEKGLDVDDENVNGLTSTEMRSSAHGDVVHSRPVAINYGTDVAPQVVVFYGGNDGVLRAVNGNRDGGLSIGSIAPGMELWSFVAPEFYANIKRIRDNTIPVSFHGSTVTSPTPEPKPYGFDGPVTAYKDGSHTWIYAAMRRGGRALYAFDATTPGSPSIKWKKGCPNLTNDPDCTTGFSGIGQTWSAAKTLNAPGYGSGASPLLIVGGGYDTCEDSDPNTCTTSSKGNKIYVLDADTGALLNTLNTDRGVVADVFVVPNQSTGLAAYAYAADLGGNVYRINIGTDAPSAWTITKIASLGCNTAGTCAANRKFMFMPDVVLDGGKYVLLLGSGDREKPLATYTSAASVSNYFFMLKDDPSDANWLTSESTNCGAAVICLNSLVPIANTGASPTVATVAGAKGWYLGLNASEQVVTSAITIFGTTSFSTHTPAIYQEGQCTSNLGTARVYNVAYANGATMNGTSSRGQEVAGGGLAPSPVGGMVTLDGSNVSVPFCIGCNSQSSLQGGQPPSPTMANQPKSRVYWQIER